MTEQEAELLSGRRFTGAVDLHSHPLPGIDDGAVDLAASLRMLLVAARYGTRYMTATPHRYWQDRENTADIIREKTAVVNRALNQTHLGHKFTLLPGQEIPLSPETASELQSGMLLTMGDYGHSVLVEPPFNFLPEWAVEALAAIVAAGYHPVLAHPERCKGIQQDPELAWALVETGASFQLTAMSIVGENGIQAETTARLLLKNGLVTLIASDCHSPSWRPPNLRKAYRQLSREYGNRFARKLCIENPAAILRGEKPKPVTNPEESGAGCASSL